MQQLVSDEVWLDCMPCIMRGPVCVAEQTTQHSLFKLHMQAVCTSTVFIAQHTAAHLHTLTMT